MRLPKLKLSSAQRRWQTDTLGELANLAFASLLIGQPVTKDFRVDLTIIGLLFTVGVWFYSNYLLKNS